MNRRLDIEGKIKADNTTDPSVFSKLYISTEYKPVFLNIFQDIF